MRVCVCACVRACVCACDFRRMVNAFDAKLAMCDKIRVSEFHVKVSGGMVVSLSV